VHSHQCGLNRQHEGDHDFSRCPFGNKVVTEVVDSSGR